MMKKCNKCGVNKELSREFYHISKKHDDGFKGDCKECRNKEKRDWRKSMPPEYFIWDSMKERCANESHPSYESYGGRGIKLSDEWLKGYEVFLKDVGKRPTQEHSIDRIDNNGNYEKGNCKWSTRNEQAANTRMYKNNKSGKTGLHLNSSNSWVAEIRSNKVKYHLGSFKNYDEAVKVRQEAELKYFGKLVE